MVVGPSMVQRLIWKLRMLLEESGNAQLYRHVLILVSFSIGLYAPWDHSPLSSCLLGPSARFFLKSNQVCFSLDLSQTWKCFFYSFYLSKLLSFFVILHWHMSFYRLISVYPSALTLHMSIQIKRGSDLSWSIEQFLDLWSAFLVFS